MLWIALILAGLGATGIVVACVLGGHEACSPERPPVWEHPAFAELVIWHRRGDDAEAVRALGRLRSAGYDVDTIYRALRREGVVE